jgi:L-fucose mutarotase
MLKGLDPLLNPDLLHALRAMGHGDELVIADANFPATAVARRLIRIDGCDGPALARAVLSVMPLDDFADAACFRMQVVDDAASVPEVCRIYERLIGDAAGARFQLAGLERFAFYDRARSAFAVAQTAETRLYGNLILKKGVIRP